MAQFRLVGAIILTDALLTGHTLVFCVFPTPLVQFPLSFSVQPALRPDESIAGKLSALTGKSLSQV
jgi:hypothetical protein